MDKNKLLFLGTPAFAAVALEALAKNNRYEILAVITQPDKPAGRGNKLKAPEVKITAERLGIKVFQPETLKDFSIQLKELGQVDAVICVAYGKIVPKALLDYPKVAAINIHPSLLPRWRGAAPVQWALFSGDSETGVCLMQMDEGLDTGPVYLTQKETIKNSDDFTSLEARLAQIGAKMLLDNLPLILSGKLKAIPQEDKGLTYAEKWDQENYRINWSEDAITCLRRIKTCSPDGARASFRGELVKIHSAVALKEKYASKAPGTIVHLNKEEIIVAVGSSQFICILEMQFPGKKKLTVRDILSGKRFEIGERFS